MYAGVRLKSWDADPDPWVKSDFRPEVKWECYSYTLCDVGVIICIHHDTDDVLIKLNCCMPVMPSSVSRSDVYFGTIWMHMQLHNVQ